MLILNVGCATSIVEGAINIDNSFSVFLSRHRLIMRLFKAMHLLDEENISLIQTAAEKGIVYGEATNLKYADESIDVVYTSHMFDFLCEKDARKFVADCFRILKTGGVLRVVVADFDHLMDNYKATGDADDFLNKYHGRGGLYHNISRKRKIVNLLLGNDDRKWLYNGLTLKRFIEKNSDFDCYVLKAGETLIDFPTAIDLHERENQSVYLECVKYGNNSNKCR